MHPKSASISICIFHLYLYHVLFWDMVGLIFGTQKAFLLLYLKVNALKELEMVNRVENSRVGLVIDGWSVGGCFWDESLKGYVGRRGYLGWIRGRLKETADDRPRSVFLRPQCIWILWLRCRNGLSGSVSGFSCGSSQGSSF
eukprot:Gb_21537 [translate_table: standard]